MSSMDLKTPLIPQEIWLQEQYSSPRYFARMLNAWERMVEVAELAYDDYMRHIPSQFPPARTGNAGGYRMGKPDIAQFYPDLDADA